MENEKVVVDMTAEDVAEQAARAYTKTVWDESTPITADKLNKIENGIANGIDKTMQIMEIPINHADGWQQFRWTKPNYNTISWTRDANQGKALEVLNETARQQLLLLGDDGGLDVQKHLIVNGGNNTEHADIFLKCNGAVRGLVRGVASGGLQLHAYHGNGEWVNYMGIAAGLITLGSNTKVEGNLAAGNLYTGNFSIQDRDLKIYNKRALVGFDTPDGNYLEINYHRDFAAGVRIQGLTKIESIETDGKLTFSNQIGGGQMSSLINCQALQNNTGNGQMMTAYDNRIYVGNPNTHLVIESGSNPTVNVGGRDYQLYHTGSKPTPWDIGAMSSNAPSFQGNMIQAGAGGRDWIYHINADAGTLHIAPHSNGNNDWDRQIMFDRSGVMYCNGRKKVPTMADQHAAHYMFRYGSGLGGANGYITFSY